MEVLNQEGKLYCTDLCVGFRTEMLRGREWKLRTWYSVVVTGLCNFVRVKLTLQRGVSLV